MFGYTCGDYQTQKTAPTTVSAGQVFKLYKSEYMNLKRNHRIPQAQLPSLVIIDGAQGKKADIVIVDSVVSSSDQKTDFDFLLNDC